MIGKILGGRYEILEEIGKGGMAVVYKAKCLLLNRIVAVKALRNDLSENQEFLKRFNTEAQAAASLSSQNIVSIYDVGEEDGIHYIVMEYVEGVTLKEYINRMKKLPWQEAVKIAIEICKGLSAAHEKNIVHRDIKPQNIMVTTTGAIKVADFGIARATTSSTITADNDVLGSVYYFSPEQARGGFVDEKTDIYSLGIVLYEMLTGNVPYDGDTPVAIAMKHIENSPASITLAEPSVPKGVEDVVFKAMSKDTLKRYQTIGEMERNLETLITTNAVAYVDDDDDMGKTKKMPALTDIKTKKEKKPEADTTNSSKKADRKAIILAIITSLIFVSILSFAAISFLNIGGFGGEKIMTPSLVGLTVDEAENLAEKRGFVLEIEGYEESDEVEGLVLSQKPKEDQVVTEKGTTIKVVLSKKPGEQFELDDFEGKNLESTKSSLEKMGIIVEVETVESEDIAEGDIVKQTPKAGRKVRKGDIVILYVSGTPEDIKQVPVPSLFGKTKEEAQKALNDVKLELGDITYAESDVEKDKIISQTLTGFVNEGTKINVVISKGKDASANNQQKTSKTLSIDLSQYTSTVKIDIVSGGKTVHSTTQDPTQNPMFSATLTGSGTVSFDIYINGAKVGSRAINFGN